MIPTTMTTRTRIKSANDALILVAAGSSSRMGGGLKKEYLPMPDGGTVLSCAARAFFQAQPFAIVAVTYPAQNNETADAAAQELCRNALFAATSAPVNNGGKADSARDVMHGAEILFVRGGATRQQSVLNALEAVQQWYADHTSVAKYDDPLVFIHDGARPFVTSTLVLRAAAAARDYGAAVPGLPPVDTQAEIGNDGRIARHLVRSRLAAVQTPQVFRLFPLVQAHRSAQQEQCICTDDTEIWDRYVAGVQKSADGSPYGAVTVIAGEVENRKVTYPGDIAAFTVSIGAESDAYDKTTAISTSHTDERAVSPAASVPPPIRIGMGYDKHRLVAGRHLMLGGLALPSDRGEDGHSDGDVLLHAITDAVLGAAALGDIGSYFPPEEAQWKDADSKTLLARCWADVRATGLTLVNLDCVIALEKPRFLPHRDRVRASIAAVLGCTPQQVFVKAKTGEKLGDIGEERAVEAWATCLLQQRPCVQPTCAKPSLPQHTDDTKRVANGAASSATIRHATSADTQFWLSLDAHIRPAVLAQKITARTCYVLEVAGAPIAILRYNLFWDNTPFCNLLYVAPAQQRRGYGSQLLRHWEAAMRGEGNQRVLTSTQVDESAQHFYRKHGYTDAGGFVLSGRDSPQPLELILEKTL